jgi:hypothetical protein
MGHSNIKMHANCTKTTGCGFSAYLALYQYLPLSRKDMIGNRKHTVAI